MRSRICVNLPSYHGCVLISVIAFVRPASSSARGRRPPLYNASMGQHKRVCHLTRGARSLCLHHFYSTCLPTRHILSHLDLFVGFMDERQTLIISVSDGHLRCVFCWFAPRLAISPSSYLLYQSLPLTFPMVYLFSALQTCGTACLHPFTSHYTLPKTFYTCSPFSLHSQTLPATSRGLRRQVSGRAFWRPLFVLHAGCLPAFAFPHHAASPT